MIFFTKQNDKGEINITQIEHLEAAIEHIKWANENGSRIDTLDLEREIKKLTFSEQYNIPVNQIYTDGFGNYKLHCQNLAFRISHNPYITNSHTKYHFEEGNKYIILDNGNIGRLMFVNTANYNATQDVWDEFTNLLKSYNPVDWDDLNFNYIYTIKDGLKLYHDYTNIYQLYKSKFDKVIRQDDIKILTAKLNELKAAELF